MPQANGPTEADETFQSECSPTARRLVRPILYHWTEMATGRRFPRLDDIDPWMVGDDWKSCLLVETRSPVEASRLLTVGENLLDGSEQTLSGEAITDIPPDTLAALLLSRLGHVVSARDSVIDSGQAALRCGT